MLHRETAESLFTKVKHAAGIHFSTFQDPARAGKSDEAVDAEAEAIAAGAQVVRSNHRPDPQWKAKNLAPAKPFEERGITILEPR